jgi:hypothetical protein
MKNLIIKGLAVVAFSFVLNGVVMAGEDVDALTLNFQGNVQDLAEVDAVINKTSFVSKADHYGQYDVLDLNYDSNH